ncbi:amidohydrolase family protein [Myxococcota bacterium]|nr:amidohydrolase family protein [Myxococcota bacterium]
MSNLLIRGGEIIDGTGSPARSADLRIQNGRVTELGPNLRPKGEPQLDASGAYVAPGFIDAHTHYDPALCWDPDCDPLPTHGVTTAVTGNCSLSLAPVKREHQTLLTDMFCFIEDIPVPAFEAGVPFEWESWSEYREAFDRVGAAVGVAPLVGHSALRLHEIGEAAIERPSTPEEVAGIAACFDRCLRDGAFGLSTSFIDTDRQGRPVPSRSADDAEFNALAAVMRRAGRGVIEFVPRFTRPDLHLADIERIHEFSRIAEVPGTWTQLTSGGQNADFLPELIDQARRTQSEGPGVFPQVSPRPFDIVVSFKQTALFIFLSAWNDWIQADTESRWGMLRDEAWRQRARKDWDDAEFSLFPVRDLQSVRINRVNDPALEGFVGASFADVVSQRGGHPSDVLADWVAENDLDPGMGILAIANGDAAETAPLLLSDATVCGASDAGAHVGMMCGAGDSTLLIERHVKQRNDMSIETAVQLLTSDVARLFGIHDRGQLQPGMAGDVTIFSVDELRYHEDITVADLPDGSSRLSRPPGGFRATVVGGVPTQLEGQPTGKRPGRMLEPTPRPA